MAVAQEAPQALTVRQLYHQIEVRLAQSGKIYKAVIRRTVQGGGIQRRGRCVSLRSKRIIVCSAAILGLRAPESVVQTYGTAVLPKPETVSRVCS